MRSHPTAGQATLEYIAAVALLAAVFLVAGPAVGAPDVGARVAGAVKHGLCVVGGDICTSSDARRAGLAPCPLRSDTTGAEASVTAFSVEVGGKWLLTVTPQSDGTVSVVRTAAGSFGVVGGFGGELTLGPAKAEAGGDASARLRVQKARGWTFADRAHAAVFLEHAARNGSDERRWPPAWISGESGGEVAAGMRVAAGVDGYTDRAELGSLAMTAGAAVGTRLTRDGRWTTYTRIAVDGPSLAVPLLPSPVGLGRVEWITEYTTGPQGPLELALRTATPSRLGNHVTETVARLDLRDPGNLAVARPWLQAHIPSRAVKRAVLERIATHGVVEHTETDVRDSTRGGVLSFAGGAKFGLGAKKVAVHQELVRATVRRGALSGTRLDCRPGHG